jgi:hypothetical protein
VGRTLSTILFFLKKVHTTQMVAWLPWCEQWTVGSVVGVPCVIL